MVVRRAVAQFVVAGLAAAALFLAGSLLVLRELGRREAVRDATEYAELVGRGVVEPSLTEPLLRGDPVALAELDMVVQERVLGERIVRVKLWTRDGRIAYSDEPRLVGSRYPLGEDAMAVLRSGETVSEISDLSGAENRYERGRGSLHEVYTRLRAPDGTPLLFETYQESAALVTSARDVWLPSALALLACVLLLWLAQVPLGWRLAKRLDSAQREREALLVRALEASADERRRIASELHDGVVQDLAGVSYSLNAAAARAPREAKGVADEARAAARRTRAAIRQLRTLLVEIHPPNLRTAGLAAALADVLAPLQAAGVQTELELPDELRLDPDVELLLFRAAGEAVRNVEQHARASSVAVRVAELDGAVRLEVVDDGVGFTPTERKRRRAEAHVGLTLLEELAERAGGRLRVESAPGRGTAFSLEVPR